MTYNTPELWLVGTAREVVLDIGGSLPPDSTLGESVDGFKAGQLIGLD